MTTPAPKSIAGLLDRLETMPIYLRRHFEALSPREAARRGPDGSFAPVEHCWHLADLEREGFGIRIIRLLGEEDPFLPDFDGDRIAEERQYARLSLQDGLAAFERARTANVSRLRSLAGVQWSRRGRQEGFGGVTLSDLPRLMLEHDMEHRSQIEAWLRSGTDEETGGE